MGVAAAPRRPSDHSTIRVPPPNLPLRGGGVHRGFQGLRQIGWPRWGIGALNHDIPLSGNRIWTRQTFRKTRSVPPPCQGEDRWGLLLPCVGPMVSRRSEYPSQPPPERGRSASGRPTALAQEERIRASPVGPARRRGVRRRRRGCPSPRDWCSAARDSRGGRDGRCGENRGPGPRGIMAVAVDLDDQPVPLADEIHHIDTDGRLAAEMPAAGSPGVQHRPEAPFGRRLLLAQGLGEGNRLDHDAPPPKASSSPSSGEHPAPLPKPLTFVSPSMPASAGSGRLGATRRLPCAPSSCWR